MLKIIAALSFILLVTAALPAAAQTCALSPQLVVGQSAQVSEGQANNLRETPSAKGKKVGQATGGAVVKVLEGPT
jgi:uncharacterized protein YgiM (DUF1202 family)